MNEITKIHLGRQPFTIAVDAHTLLRAYLAAIKQQVGGKATDVVEEVELRMAELLTERGVTSDKVVLAADIDFLKTQLGQPRDFKEDTGDDEAGDTDNTVDDEAGPKRLFRDTEHGLLAGVSAGLSAYLGVPILALRLAFVALIFLGGSGILAYLLLWLLVPEAKSSSDYLQMRGQAVTVDSIKHLVDRADVPGATRRLRCVCRHAGDWLAWLVRNGVGIGFIFASIGLLAVTATAISYLLVQGLELAGVPIFPVGNRETAIVVCGLVVLMLVAAILAVTGRAILIHKWTFPGWALAAVVASFVVVSSVGVALGFATAPGIEQRYSQLQHTEIRPLPSFKYVDVKGGHLPVSYSEADSSGIVIHTLGNIDPHAVTTTVVDNTLQIDLHHLPFQTICLAICPFGRDNITVLVQAPPPYGVTPPPVPSAPR